MDKKKVITNFVDFANLEDQRRGWDGKYLDKFLDWVDDGSTGYLSADHIDEKTYDRLRKEWEDK